MSASSHLEVSARATTALLDVLESWGIEVEPLLEGLRYDIDHLRSGAGRVDWDTVVTLLGRIRETIGWERIPELARGIGAAPSWHGPRRLARWVVSPHQLLWLSVRFFGPAMFPFVEARAERRPGGVIELDLRLPAGARPCPDFFHVTRHHIAHIPALMGLPDAEVDARIDGRSGHFRIVPPPSATLFAAIRRRVRGGFGAPATLDGLERQQEELRRITEQLGRSRQELFDLLASLPIAVCLHRNGEVVYGNPELARVMGYDEPRDMVGEQILEHVHPEDRSVVAERIARVERGERVEPADLRFVRNDGAVRVLEVTPVSPVHFGGQRTRVVVARDVTDERRLQRQLVQSERLAALGALSAGVAHEINNPLTWLRGSLEIIERELARMSEESTGTDHRPVMRDALRAAMDGANRVATIVGDLRTLSRPPDDDLEPLDVVDVLESTLRLAANQLRQRARLVRDYDDVPRVVANASRLGQVFLNLVVNAAQAIPPDAAEAHEIRVRTRTATDGRVVVEVADTGPGIPADVADRIFDPFFTTKPGEGTGLGLAISHALVTRFGGEIHVDSEPGGGTIMRVVLPPAPEARAGVDAPPSGADRPAAQD